MFASTRKLSLGAAHAVIASVFALLVFTANAWAGSTEQVLYSFQQQDRPWSGVILDAAGNLYGTSTYGGSSSRGAVYMLTPTQGGGWKETIIYSFTGGVDGSTPYAGLVADRLGNLYGATTSGGVYGDGAVFELVPVSGGAWTEKVLYSFKGFGASPYYTLGIDSAGNLYGSTAHGAGCGSNDQGTIFQLKPSGSTWKRYLLYRFCSPSDGGYPGPVSLDSAGNVYAGVDIYQPIGAQGQVIKLTPAQGQWTKTVLHTFKTAEGQPNAGELHIDNAGNIFGIASGGKLGFGTVFELTPNGSGGWTSKILYNFTGKLDGGEPAYGLEMDAKGNLFGTTSMYGPYIYGGTVYELSPNLNGGWIETTLHGFLGPPDGEAAYGGITIDTAGNLFGTTLNGGDPSCQCGVVYEVIP